MQTAQHASGFTTPEMLTCCLLTALYRLGNLHDLCLFSITVCGLDALLTFGHYGGFCSSQAQEAMLSPAQSCRGCASTHGRFLTDRPARPVHPKGPFSADAPDLLHSSQPGPRQPGPALRQHQHRLRSLECHASSQRNNRNQRGKQGGETRMEVFMRTTPGFNRFLDGPLIAGDVVMLLATEVSSERLSWEQMPYLGSVIVAAWVLAGGVTGDYTLEEDPDDNPLSRALGWHIMVAIINACITWAVAMIPASVMYAFLVSHFLVEPQSVLELQRDGVLSPQLEISVALLITMSCWRGMAAKLRV